MNQVDKIFEENNNPEDFAKKYCAYISQLLAKLNYKDIAIVIDLFLETRNEGKKIIFIGNGGSAATASHFANDIGYGTRTYDKPFKALSLTDNNAIITAVGNDDGYDEIFVKQLQVLLEPGDIIVAISASGNSPNIVKAIEYAQSKSNKVIGLSGFDGGELKQISDYSIHVQTAKGEYGPVEDLHMVFDHLIGNFLLRKVKNE